MQHPWTPVLVPLQLLVPSSVSASLVSDASLKQVLHVQTDTSTIEIQRQLVVSRATEVIQLATSIHNAEGLHTAA